MGALAAIDVLGPLRVRDAEGLDVTPDGDLQRRLLALLVLRRGTVVTAEAAIDALWPARPPKDPAAALQTHVFRLRKALPDLIASTAAGYRLDPAAIDLDADRLTAAVGEATAEELDAVLTRWRGPAYPELVEVDDARIEADRLEELRLLAQERRAELQLRAGRAEEAIADLRTLAVEHPLRERPSALLVDALAASGRTAEALRAYDDFRRTLSDDLGIEPSAAFTARHAELLAGTAADWTPEHRLPAPATSILGRDELLVEAAALTDGHRLVTLVGFGGVGKTRLLLELGQWLRAAQPDRPVVFVELATADEGSALDTVATAVGIEGRPGLGLAEVLPQALAGVELVLLLDNCEHVLESIALLAERLLARAPGVTMVATSRERLRVAGEQLCPVSPLRSTAEDDAAEQLFVERARAVVPGFEPTQGERATITEITRRLDGLPLAIELAAARLHTMELAEIADGIDHRFALLTTGARTAARHRSLGAAVEWSVGLLDDDLRTVFLDLSVFAGSFSTAAAAAICGLEPADASDAVAELTERSLVLRAPDRGHVLLETLRQYGVDEIDSGAHPSTARHRHAVHVVERIQSLDSTTVSHDPTVLLQIEDVLPEARAALAWLLENGDLVGAGRLVHALEAYGFYRLRPDVLAWSYRVIEADPADTSPFAPSMWAIASQSAWMDGDLGEVGRTVGRGVEVCERDGLDLPPILTSALGSHALFEGRLDDAAGWYRQAWQQAEHPGRRLVNIACELLARGYDDTFTVLPMTEFVLGEVGDLEGPEAALAWYAAGEADMRTDLERARSRFGRAIELADRCGGSFITGVAGVSSASIDARIGDPAVAAVEYRRLIGHWRRAGAWSTQWTMLRWVAVVLEKLGRIREAAVLVGAILATPEGNRIFGEDETLLRDLQSRLRAALGDDTYEEAVREGGVLDGEKTVEHALASL